MITKIYIILFIYHVYCSQENSGICSLPEDEIKCCTDFMKKGDTCLRNVLIQCIINVILSKNRTECYTRTCIGSYGPQCNKGCLPGYYGFGCRKKCRCEECDSVNGSCYFKSEPKGKPLESWPLIMSVGVVSIGSIVVLVAIFLVRKRKRR
ncbi:multiple epidermal growth factor-like domains protein 11 isoform X1 [Saccostrea cucullata]|uniref:multiple epidermal growth factor-like domains protein 11 isoform X1 n=1 Tax=Saccostrea cuccullata TaxID=36930 RepID=UPI002ED0B8F6